MRRPGSSARVGAGALALMLGMSTLVASGSPEKKDTAGAFHEAASGHVGRLRAQRSGEGAEIITPFTASGSASFVSKASGGVPGERDTLPMPLKHDKVTAGGDAGAWQMPSHHALLARPKDAEVTAAGGDLAGMAAGFEMMGGDYYTNNITKRDNNGGRRQLQTCSAGSSIFVTSSEFPNLEGCMSEVEVFAGGEIEYLTESGLGIIYATTPTGETEEYWFAQYLTALTSDAEQVPACNSEEPASLVHPSEATWVCLFPDGSVDYGTATTFGVDCGCDDDDGGVSPTPTTTTSATDTTTPSPVAAPTAPSPTPSGSCPEGSSITVTSSEFPNLEGCLSEVEVFEGGMIEYLTESGLGIIYATTPTGETEEYWFAQYLTALTSDAEQIPACNSEEPASLVHPSEATWVCLFPDDSVDYGTSTTFGVECGCDDDRGGVSPTPVTTTPAPVTVSPTPGTDTPSPVAAPTAPSPTPTVSCPDGSSITVTSSEFPNLEGCLSEVEVFEGGEIEYLTESGLGIIYATTPTGETEEYWFAQYLTALTSDAEQVPACNSEEPASLVHPSEATWVCLFPDGSVDYGTATTFGVECGCDGDRGGVSPTPSTTTSATDTATPSPVAAPTAPSPTPTGSCPDGSSITVTSSEFPNLEGCLSEVEVFEGGEIEYLTESGLGIIYATTPTGETEEYWFAQYLTALTSDAEQVPACNSEEPASLVHPAEATWICLFPDDSVDYGTATTFGVECGCDSDRGVVSPTPVNATPTPIAVSPAPGTTAPIPATGSPTPGTITPAPVTLSPTPGTTTPTPVTSPTPIVAGDDDAGDDDDTIVSPTPDTTTPTPVTAPTPIVGGDDDADATDDDAATRAVDDSGATRVAAVNRSFSAWCAAATAATLAFALTM